MEKEDTRQMKFTVSNPAMVGKHYQYAVTGVDQDGEYDTRRRYSEFDALRVVLSARWPGIYIPAIPEKKTLGNKDQQFVEERRSLLEKFLKECAKYDYIIFSPEFKVFGREPGEISRRLNMMPIQTSNQILEKYRLHFKVDETLNQALVTKYKDTIKSF